MAVSGVVTAVDGVGVVFRSAVVVVDVPVKTTGVTGDKHLCSVAVNGDERRKNKAVRLLVAGLRSWYTTGDNSRW
ncbi:hypothetical protein HanRHA438_Chr04g0182491 [Helianthus annuus]|nr:hypothetical protein HanRHA438_Chr04g0182491 [Helianthus annuus]